MKHKITVEQKLIVSGEVEADSPEDARIKAHDVLLPDSDRTIRSFPAGTRLEMMGSQILPQPEEFNVDKQFASVPEAVEYLKSQVDPFECLFRLLKYQCYWGDHDIACKILAASHEIIKAQQGEGYMP